MTCRWMREIRTARSRFFLCELSSTDPVYPKYPRQPVLDCAGYELQEQNDKSGV
jgi:hypothetical protein